MAFGVIFLMTAVVGVAAAQVTTSGPASTPTTSIYPHDGCKFGNPGARVHVCKESMDMVHSFVADMISRAMMGMTVADLALPVGSGILTVRPPRVTEASFAKTDYSMLPPNRIRSRLFDGHMSANGVWQFKPYYGELVGGTYSTIIDGTELNATTQLGRSYDAKPTIQPVECKTNMSHFRIDIQGSSDVATIEDCNSDVCNRIRNFFEGTICQLFEAFVKEVLNRELQRIPNRAVIQCEQCKVDYGLLSGEPTVNDTDKCIRAGLEGKYIWRGWSGVPFNAPEMEWVNHDRMYSFQVSDFTFNTLLHHAHSSGHRFSAAELDKANIQQLLSLNCGDLATTPAPTTSTKPSVRKYRGGASVAKSSKDAKIAVIDIFSLKCMGSLFANFSNFGPYSVNDTGDIVFKSSQKAPAIYVESDKSGSFYGSSGTLEFYGPASSGGNRPLLARVDVRSIRGDFMPKLNKINITGSVKIQSMLLVQPQSTFRSINSEWLDDAAQFALPVMTDLLNAFFDRFAQFGPPLTKKYKCVSPGLTVLPRTMQLDCDIRSRKRGDDDDNDASSASGETEEDDDGACRCFRNTCVC